MRRSREEKKTREEKTRHILLEEEKIASFP